MTSLVPARDPGPRGSRGAGEQAACPVSPGAVLAGVPGWWAQRARAAGLSGRWLDVDAAVETDVPDLILGVDAAAQVGTAEQLGERYVSSLPSADRSAHGRHYTPPALASHLWTMTKQALGWKRPRPLAGLVRDPACGAGALLLPVLRDHLGASARVDPQIVLAGLPNVIAGVDNDPLAAWLANVALAAELLPLLAVTPRARRRALPALVRVGDGLAPPDGGCLVSLMNPPYGRVKLSTEERARFARHLYGHANLYGLFMAAGAESLTADGVLATLVPTSFLAGRYFEAQRRVLAEEAPLRAVSFVVDRAGVFDGVLQETCLATFSPKKTKTVTITAINGAVTSIAKVATPRRSGPWILPRRADDAPTAAAALAMPLTLAQAGWKASTGPLVWNRRAEDITATAGRHAVPIMWAADIDGGTIHRDAARDRQRFLNLSKASDDQVMLLTTPAVLVQRTTAPEQNRRLVVAELTEQVLAKWGGSVVAENHLNVLRPVTARPAVDRRTLTRLLATQTLDRVMRSMSGSVAVSAYELEALPLPAADALASWRDLDVADLDAAVRAAYRPVTR